MGADHDKLRDDIAVLRDRFSSKYDEVRTSVYLLREVQAAVSRVTAAAESTLPKPPRKVKVTRWHAIDGAQNTHEWWGEDPIQNNFSIPAGCRVVALSGEYEEPWS